MFSFYRCVILGRETPQYYANLPTTQANQSYRLAGTLVQGKSHKCPEGTLPPVAQGRWRIFDNLENDF